MAGRILKKRLEAEAAEKQGKAKKKAAPRKRAATARKRKAKAPERKKIFWGVFSGTLKEEGRYPYDQKEKAEERLAQLQSRGKKLYFIQPIKEGISDAAAPAPEEVPVPDDEEVVDEVESEIDDDDDDEEEEQQDVEDEDD